MGRIGKKKKMKALRKRLGIGTKYTRYKVFDEFHRADDSRRKNSESDYHFYNRSSRPEIGMVRNFIERCTKNYPQCEIEDLIARLKSGDDIHFRSASFELFLHEALTQQGFKLLPHPALSNGSSYKPDFHVTDSNGEEFYLEAVLATEKNELEQGGEIRKGVVLDTLSRSPHENFMIIIDDTGSPKSPPSGKKLKNRIHKWLDSLNPDEVYKQLQEYGLDSVEPLAWSHDGWNLQIRPIPLKLERRGKSTNLVGAGGIEGGIIDAWSPIRDAVKSKGGKYGNLDNPLIIAVNLDSFHLDRIDEMQALFGQEQYVFKSGNAAESSIQRAPNGAWYGKHGPQYTRVSAAWVFNDLQVSSLANRSSTIYLNPWANIPAPNSLKCFPHAYLDGNSMKWIEGLSFREIYGLNEAWPEET